MKYESIADIFTATEMVRERTRSLASTISDDEAVALPEDEKWTVQEIFEHIAIVDNGATRIAARLIEASRASGKLSDGSFTLSSDFTEKSGRISAMKVEAPERVHPTGEVSIRDAISKLDANQPDLEALKADLETLDVSEAKFPHPFFGDLTAAEWLVVKTGHEDRHLAQIETVLQKIRT